MTILCASTCGDLFSSHRKDVQCARLVQRVFRGHSARAEVCRIRLALGSQREQQNFGACALQRLFRGS